MTRETSSRFHRASEPTGEDELIDWLRRRTIRRGGRWIGDDAAVLPQSERWAVTVDSQIEGVHFLPGLDPAVVARRLLAVNLSDLAAMGALPSYGFLALSAPCDYDHRQFLAALADACEEYDLDLAGGDLSRHTTLTAALTLLGHKPSSQRWLRRDEARIGEHVWLGGTVGEAAAGLVLLERGASLEGRSIRIPDPLDVPAAALQAAKKAVRRQLSPQPQLELGCWLGTCTSGAAIDVSDGLARDLSRLCARSGVGAEIDLDRLPLSRDLKRLSRTIDRDWKKLALAGGEDYVLLFTLPAGTEPPDRLGCTRIGRIVEGSIVLRENGRRTPMPPDGWDHLTPVASFPVRLAGPTAEKTPCREGRASTK